MPTITAALIAPEARADFLPKHFGTGVFVHRDPARVRETPYTFLRGEKRIYDYMRAFCAEYTGGSWDFFELSNGGFFLAPEGDERVRLICGDGFNGDVSLNAAGVIVTLYVLEELANHGNSDQDKLIDALHLLRTYALDSHPERSQIYRAID